ncbi:D-aminoacyl-tRNA deacylase [Paracrocinitomix mangrovi]|uniref:D-aminoacyl-tRNA deacylase n=1 Tax=Paracrocinitomix mangrovi TaxID=2862509 RepID=UPI001C8D1F8E|nr:D-aminoacyl-tRNA deacylase [Paracrocinitomix mangrovi]UKN00923.1 D-aminoacyl-tRNA deacylase [Paracrocinitomix mangrovi]
MKAVIQRASSASVSINSKVMGKIDVGYVILLGIAEDDTQEDIDWLANKIYNLRIFSDHDGLMNLSISDVDGGILLISQFTLYAKTKKGNRPSYIKAAKPEVAIPLYEKFISKMSEILGKEVQTGEFGANMQVSLVNDGPVTIIIDTKNKE